MGFSKTQSESAIKSYGTVQAALEAILACCDTDKCEFKIVDNDYFL